jgi:hypothetical protein
MSETKSNIDLSAFADDYLIVGERDSPDASRVFVANRKADETTRRRGDSTGVVITVVSTPPGDEANALTQYAADAGTLARLTHRRLVPVIESRWIGDDRFAIVTERINDPTLAQKLVTGEEFQSTRIAAILREVNGLLEWAREQKIVHRRVTPDNIYLEPKTDRVRIAFAIAPIKRIRQSGSHDDARTIARLAVAMLGGDPEIQSCDQSSLMELRPGLPEKFCEATSRLLDAKDTATSDDVAAYVGLIGMADPLVEGETLRDRIREEILEEQRLEREKLANERTEFETRNAEERTEFERVMAAERGAYEKTKEEERARVENERLELQKAVTNERAELQQALAAERTALSARRDELEKSVAEQKAELERVAATDRAEIERLRVSIRTAGDLEIEKKRLVALEDITGDEESVLDQEDLATPLFGMPTLPPIEPVIFNDETPVMSETPIVFEAPPMPEDADGAVAAGEGAGFWASSRNRLLAIAAAAVIAVGGVWIATASRGGPTAPARPATVARTASLPAVVPVAALPAAPAAPTAPVAFTVDSSTARLWLDSLKHAHPVDVSWATDIARVRIERAARAKAVADRQAASSPAVVSQAPTNAGATVPGASNPGAGSQAGAVPGSVILSRPAGGRPVPRNPVVRRDSTARPDTSTPPPTAAR